MENRQLRTWVFMLYPDNDKHKKAIKILSKFDNSLYIKHIAKFDDKGEQINKEHYHCILRYDTPYWLSSLLKDLKLSDEDAHLFHSFKDFKKHNKTVYKSLEEYIDYLDHNNTDKIDKYSIKDFKGGLITLAEKVINSRDLDNADKFLDLCHFIVEYKRQNPFDRYTFIDWFDICSKNGYGNLFFKNWLKMRDVLSPYIIIK